MVPITVNSNDCYALSFSFLLLWQSLTEIGARSQLFKHGMGFGSFNTQGRTIKGYEIMNMLRKGQLRKVEEGAVRERVLFMAEIFGVAA